jgi:hypothetical protein
MNFAKRLLTGLGGVMIAAMLATLLAPKSVHAVVATLVQVANTAVAPAITQNVPTLASQIVTLSATVNADSFTKVSPFYQISPQANAGGSAYITPTGQSLVITSIEFSPSAGGGTLNLQFLDGFDLDTYEQWKVTADSITNLQYPTGIVIGPNVAPIVVPSGGSTTAAFNVYLHGYLTSN